MQDEADSRRVAMAVRALMLGADRYRQAIAARYDVTVPDLIALADLYQFGALTPRAIADRLAWSTGGVTTLLDRLERAGYVTRVPNPDDRRSVLIEPTPHGQQAMQSAFELLDTAVDGPLRAAPLDLDHLVAFLEQTAAALGEHASDGSLAPADEKSS